MSFLVSVKSTENNNGYDYTMDFPEALVIDPNSKVSLVSIYYERQNKVLLDNDNSYMYVRLGSSDADLQRLDLGVSGTTGTNEIVANPELTPEELANRIEDRFNYIFGNQGYTITCIYLPATEQFQITNFYQQINTTPTAPPKTDQTKGTEYGNYDDDNGRIDCHGITAQTSNWLLVNSPIQSKNVPSIKRGGSVFEITLGAGGGAGPNDTFGTGINIGLYTQTGYNALTGNGANTPVNNPANGMLNSLCCLSYFVKSNSTGFLQIAEKGSIVLAPTEMTLTPDSVLAIQLVGEGNSNIRYLYKKHANSNFVALHPTNGSAITINDWEGVELFPVVGCDNPTIDHIFLKETIGDDTRTYVAQDFNDGYLKNGSCDFEQNDSHFLGTNYIIRKSYNANSVEDLDSGVLSPLVEVNKNSQIRFTLDPKFFDNTQADLLVDISVIDEDQRLANVVAGQTLGNDSNNGLTTDGAGADRGNPKNPRIIQFRLLGTGVLSVRANQNTDTATYTTISSLNVAPYLNNTLFCELEVQAITGCARLSVSNSATHTGTTDQPIVSSWFNLPRSTGNPNHMGTMGTNTGTGYRYGFSINRWSATSTEDADYYLNPSIGNISLEVQDETATGDNEGYIQLVLDADDNDSLGAVMGWKKSKYEFTKSGTTITGDGTYDPHYKDSNPNRALYLNLPSLNLRNVIGQKFTSTSTIAGGPVGNLQGVNRFLAKIPRYHDENGDGSKSNTGPFYYDYFPYSIPLNNATELNINDLHLTMTTDDNKYATDITFSEVLLSISNVESAGQGDNPSIGRPMVMRQSYAQQNILQSQMPPKL